MCRHARLSKGILVALLLIMTPCRSTAGQSSGERLAFERTLMGTAVELIVWSTDRGASEKAVEQAYKEIKRIENLLSVHREDSGISEINRSAGAGPVRVDEETYRLIRESKRFSQVSGGAFDITVQGLAEIWDFRRPGFRVPGPELVRKRLERVGWRKIRLDQNDSSIFLEQEGMEISLGGIAKGYAADRAAEILRASGIGGGIVSAGGDILAFGRKGNGEAWKVGVRNPRDPKKNICVLPVSDMAVATSGDYERFRMVDGERVHHIIDPRTGYPGRGCMSVTVAAGSAMAADALATSVFVLGPEAGLALLEELPDVEGIVVDSDGKITASPGLRGVGEGPSKENPNRLDSHPNHNEMRN